MYLPICIVVADQTTPKRQSFHEAALVSPKPISSPQRQASPGKEPIACLSESFRLDTQIISPLLLGKLDDDAYYSKLRVEIFTNLCEKRCAFSTF